MKLRNIILASILAIAAPALPAQTAASSLEALVAEAGAVCPQKLDQGSTLDAVLLTDEAVELHMAMKVPEAQFPVIEQNMGMMRPTLLKMMAGTADMRRIFSLASESGRGLKIVIACADNKSVSFTLSYSATELADAIK